MKCFKILFIIFICSFFINNAVSQINEIRGYRNFNFGETEKEIIKKLGKQKLINKKNKLRNIFAERLIYYEDSMKLKYDYLPFEVCLRFDSLNNLKLYKIELTFNIPISDTAISNDLFNRLSTVMIEKYGTDFKFINNMESNSIYDVNVGTSGRTNEYTWEKDSCRVELSYKLWGMYDHSDSFLDSGKLLNYGDAKFCISYSDMRLESSVYKENRERYYQRQEKEEKELKEKL